MTQRRSRTAEKLVSSPSHPLDLASSALLQSRLWSPQVEIPPFSGRYRSSPRSLLLANACRVQAERMQREDQSARGSGAVLLTVLPVFDCMDNRKSCSFIGLAPEFGFRGSALVLIHSGTHLMHTPTYWNKDVNVQTGQYISSDKRLVFVFIAFFP